jgi:hypothetical protein
MGVWKSTDPQPIKPVPLSLETLPGDLVAGPVANTDGYIPQWNGANSLLLKDGLAVPAGGLAGLTALAGKADTGHTHEGSGISIPIAMAIAWGML